MSRYYDVTEDIKKYPEAVVIIAYSRRGVGKTYSCLKSGIENHFPLVYIKRTIDDINLICSANSTFDTSPYKPLNRDLGTNIKPRKIANGIGAFNHCSDDGEPTGTPVAYAVALSAIKNVKGIDLSDCPWMVFDEFIPQITESRVLATEGEAVLDVYATVARDREKRGQEPLKLLLFANAESLYCPVIEELNIMDDLARLAVSGDTYLYLPERRILIHHINEIEIEEEEKGGIYTVMKGSRWWRKSFGGEFSKTDFSNVSPKVLKHYSPVCKFKYKDKFYYIYQKNREYYICSNRSDKKIPSFDLERDNDIRLYYAKICFDIQEACMNGRVKFSDYSLYDLHMNYSKRFKHVL